VSRDVRDTWDVSDGDRVTVLGVGRHLATMIAMVDTDEVVAAAPAIRDVTVEQ
jgi:hypothetical protein